MPSKSWSAQNLERRRSRSASTAVADGELRKSGETRQRILDSAIAKLIEGGYQKLSIATIADGAGLTRAAAIYHFPNRQEMLAAIVEHLLERRLAMYWSAVRDVPDDAHQIGRFVDIYWDQVNSPIFVAFVELLVAGRTDVVLGEILRPALERFDLERARNSRLIFTHEMRAVAGERFETIRDVARFLIEGMAFAAMTSRVDPARVSAVKAFVTRQMEDTYRRA